ncbi:MAG TPA: ATP-dependent RNA helicase HrpA [Acidimicrobiia bacterium]|nr:ATP-dependent RNA helicase HrpA [Acidimicrobiia bacterium]
MTSIDQVRARVSGLGPAEQDRFRRRLGGVGRIDDPERRRRVLGYIERDLIRAEEARAARRRAIPAVLAYPHVLPITARRDELLAAISENQVLVVAGETGSGKSTQLPKLCLELGRGIDGLIGHTQPRRIAARSIAERIAEEMGVEVGGAVGYAVRFTDRVGEETMLKVMTDGLLLAEIQRDPRLSRYDTIIIDEAHERSLTIDFLLGYLKRLLPERPDLKVIITSATIDTARFSAHFDDAPIIEVSGRTYPVEVRYRPYQPERDGGQIEAITDAVRELSREGTGDILVFCSGEREIRDAVDAVDELALPNTEVVPLYGRLSFADQHRVFEPHRGRRVVISTNVAETSLTVPGIRSVVDTGTARISRYSRRTKVQRLPIEPISRASADQRAGRCGRIGPGVCIRLYSEEDYLARPQFTEPEIQRTNLASVILQMAALGLGSIESFPFLDPPDTRTVRDGVALLEELGAVNKGAEGGREWLTDVGRILARLPLDPRLGRMMVEADRNGSLRELSTIVAALSIQDPRERPLGQEAQAAQAHARFRAEGSDFLGWLTLWDFLKKERQARSSSSFRRLCRDEYLNYRRIREWQDIRGQLRDITDDLDMAPATDPADPDSIHRALLSGLLSHVGMKEPEGFDYRGARGARFSISPGSSLFKSSPPWVMAAELVETTRTWAHQVARVDPAVVETVGAHLVNRSYSDPWWDEEKGTAVAAETVTLYGLPLAAGRQVVYGRIDPEAARLIFIRHALVLGEWETHHEFVVENERRVAEVLDMEARKRSADLLADEDALVDFFATRIPAEVWSVRHFDRWWRDVRTVTPDLLVLPPAALLAEGAETPDEGDFPTVWQHGDLSFAVEYEFDRSSPADGVTIEIPLEAVDRVDAATFEWQVPGLREELIEELIRSLPKRLRVQLIPVIETISRIRGRIGPHRGRLLEVLRRELATVAGTEILPDDFDLGRVSTHLKPRFQVVDQAGEVLGEGRDLDRIRAEVRNLQRSAVSSAAHPVERIGMKTWEIDTLPGVVTIEGPGHPIDAYPALIDDETSVSVRLMAGAAEAASASWAGTRRLLVLQLENPTGRVRRLVTDEGRAVVRAGPHAGVEEWLDDCVDAAVDAVMRRHPGVPPRTAAEFAGLAGTVQAEVDEVVHAVAEISLEILDRYSELALALDEIPDVFEEAALDMAAQVNRLVYPGFVTAVGSHLVDISRYLDGVAYRIGRLAEAPGRDRERMGRVRALEDRYDRLADTLPAGPELTELGWQLQELRMALFAQSLGVEGGVSEKKLRQALMEVAAASG